MHESIYDAMCDELAALANAAVVDDGLKQGTQLGPLQNKMQYDKVKGYPRDARANGKIIAGGDAPDRPGYFIQPTIVRDITDGSRLVDEEQFGPVLPVIKFTDRRTRCPAPTPRPTASAARSGRRTWTPPTTSPPGWRRGTVWINKHPDIWPPTSRSAAPRVGHRRRAGRRGPGRIHPAAGDQHRRLRRGDRPSI